ncbi:CBS domain-containing protein [Erythrobacter rubeus]|uniref:CBS domain-containing protein n=1 Tax=Erythrobacter rubeus TaxID=2760803 RepID=A0ABR8KT95_9SPHN|nr:CBS domain-containing protein [Erythrobacter rubeus]MBD2843194.1 CBS domain-containing protein [Erythrobacter rubeus]
MTIAKIIANRSAADIDSCDCTTPVSEAINMLAGKRIGALPVMRNGSVVGIISERDVIYCLSSKGGAVLNMPVEEIMTSPAVTVEPSTKIDDAMALMTKRRFRHFPVVENGALVAFISIGDLVKNKIDEIEHEAEAIRNYIQTA